MLKNSIPMKSPIGTVHMEISETFSPCKIMRNLEKNVVDYLKFKNSANLIEPMSKTIKGEKTFGYFVNQSLMDRGTSLNILRAFRVEQFLKIVFEGHSWFVQKQDLIKIFIFTKLNLLKINAPFCNFRCNKNFCSKPKLNFEDFIIFRQKEVPMAYLLSTDWSDFLSTPITISSAKSSSSSSCLIRLYSSISYKNLGLVMPNHHASFSPIVSHTSTLLLALFCAKYPIHGSQVHFVARLGLLAPFLLFGALFLFFVLTALFHNAVAAVDYADIARPLGQICARGRIHVNLKVRVGKVAIAALSQIGKIVHLYRN
ncbi:hypothetical protein BpHYR1_007243 [Brachionus plicatilis]|uniref:Uncharacterized protein n=1 Tax=Brachionus plicatilis TaxID=10195 RepID=A0A3M7T8C3_BRAPC|nr:hypothetical protein BpHYR1_007243 [Brachionus plicatilis]